MRNGVLLRKALKFGALRLNLSKCGVRGGLVVIVKVEDARDVRGSGVLLK